MNAKSKAKPTLLLTHQKIRAALKTGLRRHLFALHKGLELEVLANGDAKFRYYYKERVGDKRYDRRHPLGNYDPKKADCLIKIEALWESAHEQRKRGEPIVLEYPEQSTPLETTLPKQRKLVAAVSQVVPQYVKHLERSLDLSPKTVKPWVFIIKRFEREFASTPLHKLDVERLNEYLDELIHKAREQGADGRSTRMNTRSCLINFYEWAVAKQYVASNIAAATEKKKYKRDHVMVPLDDISKYLIALRSMRMSQSGERLSVTHYLWLICLTGCRHDELANAKVGHFYRDERQRLIVASDAKDDKNHLTGISHIAVRVVNDQLALLAKMGCPTTRDAYLFPQKAGLKRLQRSHGDGLYGLGEHVIYKHHRKVCRLAGIEPFKIQDFRRIFATMAAKLGIGHDFERLLVSHTTGRREVHNGTYNLHKYESELREAASRISVAFDFLSSEKGVDGKRHPLECEKDFFESFGYWYSETGRQFISDTAHAFHVSALVARSKAKLHERDIESGFATGDEEAIRLIRQSQVSSAAKVKRLGQELAGKRDAGLLGDVDALPFSALDEHDDAEGF